MRTGLLTLVLFAIVITGTRCEDSHAQMIQDQPKNPEAEKLAKAIVNAISTDNYAAFTDLIVTQREYVTVLQSSTTPRVQQVANDSIRGMQQMHKRARNSFDDVRKGGMHDGLAWERVKYKSTTYTIDTLDGVELIDMKIWMDFRGVEYVMTAQEVVKTKSGWKMFGELAYGDRGKRMHAEDLARKMQDSIAMADSIMAVMMYMEAESMRLADSMAMVRAMWTIDSIRMADSIAASEQKKKGKKKK